MILKTTSTIADQIRAAYPFTVDKFPLRGPDGLHTPHYGLFRSDTGASVGHAVTAAYEPHTTDDVAALCEAAAAGWSAGSANLRATWTQDAHVISISPSDDQRRELADRSAAFPRLVIRAGYRGCAATGQLAIFRDRCRNLMFMTHLATTSFYIHHRTGLRTKLAELTDRFGALAAAWPRVVAEANSMDERQIPVAEFLGQLFPAPDEQTRRQAASYNRRIETILLRMSREREQAGRDPHRLDTASGWELFNAIQGWSQHDRRRRGAPDAFTRALLAADDPIVAHAQELALAM